MSAPRLALTPGPIAPSPSSPGPRADDKVARASIRLLEQDLLSLADDCGFYSAMYFHLGHAPRGGRDTRRPLRVLASSVAAYTLFEETIGSSGFLDQAATAHKPFTWSSAIDQASTPGGTRRVGVMLPVQDHAAGPGVVALVGVDADQARRVVEERGLRLAAAATDIHLRALALVRSDTGRTPTIREIECLRLAALGMTAPETARVLGITSRTVAFHLDNISDKLGAINKVHAVAIGISEGLLRL